MYLTNHSNYNMNSLLETFDKDIETFTNKNIYLLSKKLLTGEINSECDNEYLIDIIDEKILRK